MNNVDLFLDTSAGHLTQLSFVELCRYLSLFLLVLSMVVFCLLGLTVMRGDAERLVLFPLQRMLLIVVRCKLGLASQSSMINLL